ncbi:MAG: hypothetical protein BWY80_00735 [Firmicutes bacterium ADurb.Bin456]|nr:MAG: hypothetical protein BWY80_00735 [Firmicutes bacterium ADurb.Bin456]
MVLCLYEVTACLQVPHNPFAAFVTIQALVAGTGLLAHFPFLVNYNNLGQMMSQPHFEVVGIVGRGNFNSPGAKGGIHVLIGNDRHLPAHQGQDQPFSPGPGITFIPRVYSHSNVPQDGFRTGCSHNDAPGPVLVRISDVVEVPGAIQMFYLNIRNSGMTLGAPVGNIITPVNQTPLIEFDKYLQHGFGAPFVHGETLPLPVTRGTQLAQLGGDPVAVLLFPGPDPF